MLVQRLPLYLLANDNKRTVNARQMRLNTEPKKERMKNDEKENIHEREKEANGSEQAFLSMIFHYEAVISKMGKTMNNGGFLFFFFTVLCWCVSYTYAILLFCSGKMVKT